MSGMLQTQFPSGEENIATWKLNPPAWRWWNAGLSSAGIWWAPGRKAGYCRRCPPRAWSSPPLHHWTTKTRPHSTTAGRIRVCPQVCEAVTIQRKTITGTRVSYLLYDMEYRPLPWLGCTFKRILVCVVLWILYMLGKLDTLWIFKRKKLAVNLLWTTKLAATEINSSKTGL